MSSSIIFRGERIQRKAAKNTTSDDKAYKTFVWDDQQKGLAEVMTSDEASESSETSVDQVPARTR